MIKLYFTAAITLAIASPALGQEGYLQPLPKGSETRIEGTTFYELCDDKFSTVKCRNIIFQSNESVRTKQEKENFWKHQSQFGSVGAGGASE